MLPEPSVEFNGVISDESEHLAMLDNPVANAMADDAAIRYAVKSGMFTQAEAEALLRDPRDMVTKTTYPEENDK